MQNMKAEISSCVLRDTDQERYVEGALDLIYKTMDQAGLKHDEGPDKDGGYGPYVQSERVKTGIYLEYAKKKLVEKERHITVFVQRKDCRNFMMKQKQEGKRLQSTTNIVFT